MSKTDIVYPQTNTLPFGQTRNRGATGFMDSGRDHYEKDTNRTLYLVVIGALALLLFSEIFFDAVSDPWGYDPMHGGDGWDR